MKLMKLTVSRHRQTYSCPRDWHLLASWGPIQGPVKSPVHHCTIVLVDLCGNMTKYSFLSVGGERVEEEGGRGGK